MPTKTQIIAKSLTGGKAATPSTRERLIEVGLGLMRRYGYGETGVQEILDAAGVPKGSFYHHFGSKEEFTAAVVERYVTLEGEHCQEVLGSTKQTPLKRLRRYFEDLVISAGQTSAVQGCLIGSLSLEVAGASAVLQKSLSSGFAGWQSAVSGALQEAVDIGELAKSTRVEALAGFVLNSWEGALLRSQADKSDEPLDYFLHYIFEEMLVRR